MNLFAYGTLMWPDILAAVTGRRMTGERMVLDGYKRLRVIGQHYPVILPSENDSVEGVLYRDLTVEEFAALDVFEGEEYDCREVMIGETKTFVYVLSDKWKQIADSEPWNPEHMKPEHLSAFRSETRRGRGLEETDLSRKCSVL